MSGCDNTFVKRCDVVDLANPVGDFIHNCRTDFTCHDLTGIYRCNFELSWFV